MTRRLKVNQSPSGTANDTLPLTRVSVAVPDVYRGFDFFEPEPPGAGENIPILGKTAHSLPGAFHPVANQHILDFGLA